MKHEKWLSGLIGGLLGFCIAIAGGGCIVTAFGLKTVDLAAVIGLCALCAAAGAVCFSFRRGGLALLAAGALLIGYLIRGKTLVLQLEALLNTISRLYDQAYGWGALRWSDASLEGVPLTGALALICGLIAVAVCWVVCQRKMAFFAAGLGFLPLAACFVVTDTVPQPGWIWLLFAGLALLLLTQSVRRRNGAEGCRLTAILLIPVVLVSMLLFYVHPQEKYESQSRVLQQTMLRWINGLPFVVTTPDGELTISVDGVAASHMDLSAIGPKTQLRYAVMDVVSEDGGLIYLRGQSLDSYDGTSWQASDMSTGRDGYFPSKNMKKTGNVRVSFRSAQGRLYVPYYIEDDYEFRQGRIENEESVREYSYAVMTPIEGLPHLELNDLTWAAQCLQLPDSTRSEAEKLLKIVLGGAAGSSATAAKAQTIAEYVRNSAEYDLNTQRMPAGEADFAMWFLRDGETGYCVHFATATAVLLRAAGIPARYVTGYTFHARPGSRVTVQADKAHAWVEYLDPSTGWTVLDATPGEWMGGDAMETEPTEPEQTLPVTPTAPETTEPTATEPMSTQPEETQPEQKDPDETTGSSGPGEHNGQRPKVDLSWLWTALQVLLWSAGAAVLGVAQYWLRLRHKSRKMHTGPHNSRALARWREVLRLAKLTKWPPSDALEALAEKAKFSQHTLTAAELREFDIWLEKATEELLKKPWPIRLAIRLIWAIG